MTHETLPLNPSHFSVMLCRPWMGGQLRGHCGETFVPQYVQWRVGAARCLSDGRPVEWQATMHASVVALSSLCYVASGRVDDTTGAVSWPPGCPAPPNEFAALVRDLVTAPFPSGEVKA